MIRKWESADISFILHSDTSFIRDLAINLSYYSNTAYCIQIWSVFSLPSLRSLRRYLEPVGCNSRILRYALSQVKKTSQTESTAKMALWVWMRCKSRRHYAMIHNWRNIWSSQIFLKINNQVEKRIINFLLLKYKCSTSLDWMGNGDLP